MTIIARMWREIRMHQKTNSPIPGLVRKMPHWGALRMLGKSVKRQYWSNLFWRIYSIHTGHKHKNGYYLGPKSLKILQVDPTYIIWCLAVAM